MIKVPSSLFQSRAQGLMKQVQDLHEQLEQTYVECTTFENLRQHEIGAIPKRMEVGGNKLCSLLSCIYVLFKFD